MFHQRIGPRIDYFMFGLKFHTFGVVVLQMYARPDVQSNCCNDYKDANNLNQQAPCVTGLETQVWKENRLQHQNGNHKENKKSEIPCPARTAGSSVLIVATDESEIHHVEDEDGEQRYSSLRDSDEHASICNEFLCRARREACKGDHRVIRIFQMETQPALDIVGPGAKTHQPNIVFEGFL